MCIYLSASCTYEYSLAFIPLGNVTKVIRGDLQQRCEPGTNMICYVQNSLPQHIHADTKVHVLQSLEHLNSIMVALSQITWKSLLGDIIVTLVTKHMGGLQQMGQPSTLVLELCCDSVSQKAPLSGQGDCSRTGP